MDEGAMIEEDTIVDMPLEADTVEDIEVAPGATLHTESLTGRLDGNGRYNIRDGRKDSKDSQRHQSRRKDLCHFAGTRSKD